jgi:hypothetical protein
MTTQSPDVSDRRLAWIDDKAQPQPIFGATRNFGQVAVSPDGERVLVQLDTPGSAERISDLGVQDLIRRSFTRIPVQGESERTTMTVGLVVNFLEELRAKMATAK